MRVKQAIIDLILQAKDDERILYNDVTGEFYLSHQDKCRFIVTVLGLLHNAHLAIFTKKGLDFLFSVEDSHDNSEIKNIGINNWQLPYFDRVVRLFTNKHFTYFEVSRDSKRFEEDVLCDIGQVMVEFGSLLREVDNGSDAFISDTSGLIEIIAKGQEYIHAS